MRKNERFKFAMEQSGLVGQVEADFRGWGVWRMDNADTCLWLQQTEKVNVALVAHMWLNESTGRFLCEPNTNKPRNPTDDFELYDVGPAQLNVAKTRADIANKFLNVKGIDVGRALGTKTIFPDPFENLRLASRKLLRIGQGTIVGPSETILYYLAVKDWASLTGDIQNERRAVAYTGPEARPARYQSWVKYAPMFTTFFKLYADV